MVEMDFIQTNKNTLGVCSKTFFSKLYIKIMLDSYIPYAILKGRIRTVLKNGKTSNFSNGNY